MHPITQVIRTALASTCGLRRVFPVLLGCFSVGLVDLRAAEAPAVFETPESALEALGEAVNHTNRAAFIRLFGSEAQDLVNPDDVQGANELQEFANAFNASRRLVTVMADRRVIEVGSEGWPFPVPLVRTARGWCYDASAGREEILNRRIGRNELDVLRVMRAYVEAQREYASRDRDNDSVLEYAQKLGSAPGKTDGLYWPLEINGELSPLGPLVAYAQAEGYSRTAATEGEPQAFHGYLFKVLARQGKHAPGGKYDYVINGNMIGGFAMVAWPARYGETGVMTFVVNQQGRVYQRDVGEKTAKFIRSMKAYDLEQGWAPSPD